MKIFILDGSNLLYWASAPYRKETKDKTYPAIVLKLLLEIKQNGNRFVCFFDNYSLENCTDKEGATLIMNLTENYSHKFEIMSAAKADEFILSTAGLFKAPIITNDKYKEFFQYKDREKIQGQVMDLPGKENFNQKQFYLLVPQLNIKSPIDLINGSKMYYDELIKLL